MMQETLRRSSSVFPFVIDVIECEEKFVSAKVEMFPTMFFNTQAVSDSETLAQTQGLAFQQSLRPLLFSMKLFGIFFEKNNASTTRHFDMGTLSQKLSMCLKKEKYKISKKNDASPRRYGTCWVNTPKIYATVVLLVMWVQFFRMFSAFTREDTSTIAIISKLLYVNYTLKCALMFTSYYRASYGGALRKSLNEIQIILEHDMSFRKRVLIYTVLAWIVTIVNTSFMICMVLYPSTPSLDSLLAPINTQITNFSSTTILVVQIIFITFNVYMNASWVFAGAASSTITSMFATLFLDINARVKLAIGADGRFEGDLERFRQQHQHVSRLIDESDKYISLYMGSTVVCNIATFVMVLYSLIFDQLKNTLICVILAFWIVASALHLTITAFGAVKVNNAVSIANIIVNYDSYMSICLNNQITIYTVFFVTVKLEAC